MYTIYSFFLFRKNLVLFFWVILKRMAGVFGILSLSSLSMLSVAASTCILVSDQVPYTLYIRSITFRQFQTELK